MQVDKSQIIALLNSRGEHDKAARVESDFPERIDPEAHAARLQELGIDPQDVTGRYLPGESGSWGLGG